MPLELICQQVKAEKESCLLRGPAGESFETEVSGMTEDQAIRGEHALMTEKRTTCIGAGYVDGPTVAMIAMKCPQYQVVVTDPNKARIDAWQTDALPIFEP